MPFIGQQPTQGRFIELDSLTASATANYTLQLNSANYSPESVNNLLVSINGVIQGSSTMSLNGAVLTVGATLSSSDTIDFVRVFGNVGTVSTPTDGSVTANKIGNNAVDLTTKVTGVLPVANGGTGKSSDNKGLFQVYSNANENLANNSYTQVSLNAKVFDLDSYFNTSTYRYTPQVAGYYYIETQLMFAPKGADDNCALVSFIYKNGSNNHSTGSPYINASGTGRAIGQVNVKVGAGKENQVKANSLVYLNGSSDYVDLRGYIYNYTQSSATDNLMMGHSTIWFTYMLGYRVV